MAAAAYRTDEECSGDVHTAIAVGAISNRPPAQRCGSYRAGDQEIAPTACFAQLRAIGRSPLRQTAATSAFPFGEGGRARNERGRMRSPVCYGSCLCFNDVVQASRTSSVFCKTMQAFFEESTFPKGEGLGIGYPSFLIPHSSLLTPHSSLRSCFRQGENRISRHAVARSSLRLLAAMARRLIWKASNHMTSSMMAPLAMYW